MSKFTVISRLTHQETVAEGNQIVLGEDSVIKLQAGRGDIASYSRSNNDLLVRMTNGETVTLKNYYVNNHKLVLDENGALWWIDDPLAVERYQSIPSTDALIAGNVSNSSSDTPIWPWVLGGVAAAGGIALAAGGGGGGGGGGGSDRIDPGPAVLDTTPPGAPTNLHFANGNTQLLGSAEANSTVTITDASGNVVGKAKTNGNGEFTVELGTPYTNGETLTAKATDGSGNVSPPTSITAADTTAPDAPMIIIADDDVGSITGALNSGGTTDDPRPVFSGSGEAGSTITLYDNGKNIGSTVVNSDGSWTFTPASDLAEGLHQITASATDPAGNTGPDSEDFILTIDTIAPDAPVLQVMDSVGNIQGFVTSGGFTDATQPVLSGTGDPGSTITLYHNELLLAEIIVPDNGSWSYTPVEPLIEGEHSFTLTETDVAGNLSPTSAPFEFTVDRTPPAAPSGLAINATGTILTGSAEPNSTVTVTNNLGESLGTATADVNGAFTLTLTTPQTNGETLSAVATDRAGNEGPEAPLIVPDTTAPAAPTALVVAETGDSVSGEAEANARISIRDATGQEIGTGTVEADGKFSVNISPNQLNGEVLTVYAFDTANNQSPPAQATANDSTPPAPPAGLDVSDDGLALTGTAEAGSTVVIMEGTNKLGEVVVSETGSFSFTLPVAKLNGEIMSLTATDHAGNTSDPSTVEADDITPPATPIITNVADNVPDITGTVVSGTLTDDRTPLISGTGEIGTKIFVYSEAIQIGMTEVDSSGNWSFQVPASLTDGIHSLTADAVDRRGNHSLISETWTIDVDPAAPNPPTTTTTATAFALNAEPTGETLIYNVLSDNGGDHVSNFSLAEGDKIDISQLLVGWNGDRGTLGEYLQVNSSDGNTVISIDRDGTGTSYAPATLVTLDDVQTTYEELVNQNHIITG
ncbi:MULTISPECIES: Ig-like domain-containing protein [unclassified Leclercia]|uniref:BapA prefix-like domain-containing protein n=1 Tax=Leclercia barmai TaxID=2785629 RepID=A0ABS7RWN9_9ENTR|nr:MULTISPECIES: Ig-like domain-containing protein [unclassified Leclercia]MBZ0058721.1 BapA prefix-like domain-containing protein [Leclercia sp. EMC7]MCM5696131.1 Ig-like domain-containing protein [Leclercia sp. LTM01]MCM5702377.1 BapA prefix-like domain-containing protein [Leclercia sp. LTM14]